MNAPFNETVTVTNLDTGQALKCVNKHRGSFTNGIEIQLTNR